MTCQMLMYLNRATNPGLDEEIDAIFEPISRTEMPKFVKQMSSRLYNTEVQTQDQEEQNEVELIIDNADTTVQPHSSNKSNSDDLEKELQEAIYESQKCQKPTSTTSANLLRTNRKEIALFEEGGDKGHLLNLVFDALMTVPPTSVEPERAFSSAGYLCSKIRSSLGDETLDELSFLRSYFQSLAKDK